MRHLWANGQPVLSHIYLTLTYIYIIEPQIQSRLCPISQKLFSLQKCNFSKKNVFKASSLNLDKKCKSLEIFLDICTFIQQALDKVNYLNRQVSKY